MSVIARQSTARTVIVGPVLDAAGVAITDAVVGDFKLAKNGAAPAALNGSATLTHRNTGHYSLALTTSDLDSVGQSEVVIDKTTAACPVKVITVIEQAVYDALFAAFATGKLPATIAAGDIANSALTNAAFADGALSAAKFAADALSAIGGAILVTPANKLATDASGHVTPADGSITAAKAPNLDAAISSRAAAATALSNVTWTDARAGNLDNLDAAVSSRLATAGYTAPDNAGISTAAANSTTLLARLGAFTGSGVNTVLGFFQALFRKDASTPSDIGGTFNPATDSLETQQELGLTIFQQGDATQTVVVGIDGRTNMILADTNEVQISLAAGGLTYNRLMSIEGRAGVAIIRQSTIQSATADSVTLDPGASSVPNFYRHCAIKVADQWRVIQSYDGDTKIALTVPSFETTPSGGAAYSIVGGATVHVFEVEQNGIKAESFETSAIDAIKAGLATATELAKVPRVGTTHRHVNQSTLAQVDVAISEVP